MLLTKKSDSTVRAGSPFVHRLQRGLAQAIPTMDRRAFLRRSGLGVGVGLAATQLTLVKKSQAAGPNKGDGPARSRSSARCAPIARWVVPLMRWLKTASGCAKNPCLTRPSTWAPIAPRVQHCANTAMESFVCATP